MKKSVARVEPETMPAPAEPVSFLSMIERAARDPQFDVVKLERLLAVREREQLKEAEKAFFAALVRCQAQMRPIAADLSNSQTRSRYASYMALDRAMRPIFTAEGFALTYDTDPSTMPDFLTVTCDVSHTAGHVKRYSVPMPCDGKGAKGNDVMTKTHAVGAAMTYGQRYLLKLIFNVTVGDDNDGNDVGGYVSDEQVAEIQRLLTETKTDIDRFLRWGKIESISDLPASKFEDAQDLLKLKLTRPQQ